MYSRSTAAGLRAATFALVVGASGAVASFGLKPAVPLDPTGTIVEAARNV